MSAPGQYVCRYCRQFSDASQPSCVRCGAPTDVRAVVSTSGWQKQPAVADMARIQFGQSYCQIEGTGVPVAEFALGPSDWIYFSHHNLLWTDPAAQLGNSRLSGGWNRVMAGLPLVMVEGRGPGHIALSDNHAGDIVTLPLNNGQGSGCASIVSCARPETSITPGNRRRSGSPPGRVTTAKRITRWACTATSSARKPRPDCCCCIRPATRSCATWPRARRCSCSRVRLLYRDLSVQMHLHLEYPHSQGMNWWRSFSYRNVWLRLIGPGRVAVQSIFERPEDSEMITSHSPATARNW